MAPGNIPNKTAAQRAKLRARAVVRRQGMNHRPKGKGSKNA